MAVPSDRPVASGGPPPPSASWSPSGSSPSDQSAFQSASGDGTGSSSPSRSNRSSSGRSHAKTPASSIKSRSAARPPRMLSAASAAPMRQTSSCPTRVPPSSGRRCNQSSPFESVCSELLRTRASPPKPMHRRGRRGRLNCTTLAVGRFSTAPMTVRPSASRSSSTMALCKYCLSSVKLSAVLDVRSTSPAGSVDGSCGGEAAEATGADGWGNRCCRTHSHSRRSSKQPRVRSTSSCLPIARMSPSQVASPSPAAATPALGGGRSVPCRSNSLSSTDESAAAKYHESRSTSP
mmetsp:Transcript_5722/g.18971  ORF Transcript_5722/g.18971 Transcript_5722/m.18971 type:complete len:292 (-) Transcript_5722:838-1713(-)